MIFKRKIVILQSIACRQFVRHILHCPITAHLVDGRVIDDFPLTFFMEMLHSSNRIYGASDAVRWRQYTSITLLHRSHHSAANNFQCLGWLRFVGSILRGLGMGNVRLQFDGPKVWRDQSKSNAGNVNERVAAAACQRTLSIRGKWNLTPTSRDGFINASIVQNEICLIHSI